MEYCVFSLSSSHNVSLPSAVALVQQWKTKGCRVIAGFNQSQRASEFESVGKVEHWAKSGRDSICLGGTISSTKNRTGGVAFYVCIHLRTSPTILYCTYRNRSQTHLESYVSPLFWSIQTSQTEPVCLGRFSLSLLLLFFPSWKGRASTHISRLNNSRKLSRQS